MQVHTVETFSGTRWNDDHKLHAMLSCFKGAALSHVQYLGSELRAANKQLAYREMRKAMEARFCCRLMDDQLGKRLEEPKEKARTWSQHVDFMRIIANHMEGANKDRIILNYFCNYACPEKSELMWTRVNSRGLNHSEELDSVLFWLIQQTGDGAGIAPRPRYTVLAAPKRNDNAQGNNKRHGRGGRPERGDANSAGGTKPKKGEKKQRTCFICDDPGHVVKDCPEKKKREEKRKGGSANSALGTNASDSIFAEDDGGAIWMAVGDNSSPSNEWLLHSGASHHIIGDKHTLANLSSCALDVYVADDRIIRSRMMVMVEEALAHQAWLRNRLPTRGNAGHQTPLEVLTGKKPDLKALRKWGQKLTVHVKSTTMGTRKKCEIGYFLGFDTKTKGYRSYIERIRKIVVTQRAKRQ
ncbi:TPA: hypothetical protein N0F65_005630 [Lagenidium giganteum]|uniref:CCHC-type domain-containing protein n=1 Tax=Lagenidium giganteum TaxID=4803 RepID=A0AAV2YXY7_9STRA|nr:TPA: hypothetical protein N0F65_005630 [Lagenidium giganteum]